MIRILAAIAALSFLGACASPHVPHSKPRPAYSKPKVTYSKPKVSKPKVSKPRSYKLKMYSGSSWSFTIKNHRVVRYNGGKLTIFTNTRGNQSIVVDGSVTEDLYNKLKTQVSYVKRVNAKNGIVPVVYLHSGGGNAYYGMVIGRMMRANRVSTRVEGDMVCASACANIFIGGTYRNIENSGRIIVHAPYNKDTKRCVSRYSEIGAVFSNYAKTMLSATAARFYNNQTWYCNINGGNTITDRSGNLIETGS